MVQEAPPLEDVVAAMLPLLEDAILVGHNVNFDVGFLQHALTAAGYTAYTGMTINTIDWCKMMFPSMMSYQLSAAAATRGIRHERPHRADSDAWVTARLWLDCLRQLKSLHPVTLQRLMTLWQDPHDAVSYILHEVWSDHLVVASDDVHPALGQKAFGDTTMRSEAHEPHVGHHVYRGFVMGVTDWGGQDTPKREHEATQSLSFDTYAEAVHIRMQQQMAQYERRPAQQTLIAHVAEALQQHAHYMIEAATGTGKSLGYLLPAIHYAHTHQEKVVVSTHTITLQEQLRNKELPLLHAVSPFPFVASILKGRSHYMCLRKFEGVATFMEGMADREERLTLSQMIVWLSQTHRGDKEELYLGQRGQEAWQAVASDAESCLNRACPWFRKCFYHRAKHDAHEADLVVTNHALLFSDAVSEHRVLPAYTKLIIDEAHHLDDVGRQHLGIMVGYFPLVMSRLRLQKDSRTGQLPTLFSLLLTTDKPHLLQARTALMSVNTTMDDVRTSWESWFALWYEYVQQRAESRSENGLITIRLQKQSLLPLWTTLVETGQAVIETLQRLIQQLQNVFSEANKDTNTYPIDSVLTNIHGTMKEIERIRNDVKQFLVLDETHTVSWVECQWQGKGRPIRLFVAPISIAPLMQHYFWQRKQSVVLTSATLTVNQSFEYVQQQLGMPAAPHNTVQLASHFNYMQQALLLIPRDFPVMQGSQGDSAFIPLLIASLSDAAVVTQGRMLVLFTSYKMLRQVHGGLKERLRMHNIHVLGQGVDTNNRTKLTRQFVQMERAVLLGTSSFWEGVDFPGDTLICLAIVRLPFQPPNHPIQQALSEWYHAQQRNAFRQLSVPQAIIKFKQGFGRLVRTANDRGVVIVYDTRILHASYGKLFLNSLPQPRIEQVTQAQLPQRIASWLHPSTSSEQGG